MLFAIGWAIVRASRGDYSRIPSEASSAARAALLETLDDETRQADLIVFDRLEDFLRGFAAPDLSYGFNRQLNNVYGVLQLCSSRNHRGQSPSAVEVLRWLAANAAGSYGLVYLHDDEDQVERGGERGRDGTDRTGEFRVWRLRNGCLDELDDPFLSPIFPLTDPT